jgi:hypothetical protein
MNMKLHTAHLHAQHVASSTYAAHWAEKGRTCEHLAKSARNELVYLLAGEPAGTTGEVCRAALIDLIATAIVDSTDIDCTPESQAEAILEDILDNCLPLPAEDAS